MKAFCCRRGRITAAGVAGAVKEGFEDHLIQTDTQKPNFLRHWRASHWLDRGPARALYGRRGGYRFWTGSGRNARAAIQGSFLASAGTTHEIGVLVTLVHLPRCSTMSITTSHRSSAERKLIQCRREVFSTAAPAGHSRAVPVQMWVRGCVCGRGDMCVP